MIRITMNPGGYARFGSELYHDTMYDIMQFWSKTGLYTPCAIN